MDVLKRRAVTEDQKLLRRQAILDGALQLLAETPFEELTVAVLADRLKLAKGTLYLYFPTKESLFLAIEQLQLQLWFADLRAVLTTRKGQPTKLTTPEQLADKIAASLQRHPLLPPLLTVLHNVLERNITHEEALAFKYFLREEVGQTAAVLQSALKLLPPGHGVKLILQLHALTIGTWQMTDNAAVVRDILADPKSELAVFDLQFQPLLRDALRNLVRGLCHKSHRPRHSKASTATKATTAKKKTPAARSR